MAKLSEFKVGDWMWIPWGTRMVRANVVNVEPDVGAVVRTLDGQHHFKSAYKYSSNEDEFLRADPPPVKKPWWRFW